nr:helicase-related protein [Candidatus Sigynarchaeota archaeon]
MDRMSGENFTLNESITPRLYQQRIFAKGLDGNVLVILPTGLGKTLIASMLAIHRLNQVKGSKIVFLAPTKPLIMQHVKTFDESTSVGQQAIAELTGEMVPEKRRDAWCKAIACFMTPQTLENDLKARLYSLSNVSLLVIDEAHKAVGEYAYTWRAKEYMATGTSPRILALTASPGVTVDQINVVKQNLFIDTIEARDENDADVKPYIHATRVHWEWIDLPAEFLAIKQDMQEEYDKVEKFMKERKLVPDMGTKALNRAHMLDITKNADLQLKRTRDPGERAELYTIIKVVAVGLRLSHALELLETQGLKPLQLYIEKALSDVKKETRTAPLQIFTDIIYRKQLHDKVASLVDAGVTHPKMDVLWGVVTRFLQDMPESRVIIFSNYRATVSLIVETFTGKGMASIERFIGQQASGNDKGMTQKQQGELLDRFRSGDIKILVATSVAEEGLDIGEVDLVVFYDVVPSAIRTIQRRGRTGRKRTGKVIVLVARGTRDEAYYYAVRIKEQRMKSSLKSVKEGPDPSLDSFQ